MKTLHILFFIIVFFAATIACRKNKLDPAFRSEARISLTANEADGARADSIVFTFAIWPSSLVDTQINLYAQVMGNLVDRERAFKVEVDTSSTAKTDEYEYPKNLVVPPGNYRVAIPVKIKRSARLVNAQAKLKLNIVPNDNFLPGPRVSTGLVNSGPSYSIIWSDQLTKPAFWDQVGVGMLWTVGKWSKVKHQLIIDATGIRNFQDLTTADKYYIASKSLEYLNAYNAGHPGNPMKNENGLVIDICSQCD